MQNKRGLRRKRLAKREKWRLSERAHKHVFTAHDGNKEYAPHFAQQHKSIRHSVISIAPKSKSLRRFQCKVCARIWGLLGLFFPSGPFSLLDVRSFSAACILRKLVVILFLSFFVRIPNSMLREGEVRLKTTRQWKYLLHQILKKGAARAQASYDPSTSEAELLQPKISSWEMRSTDQRNQPNYSSQAGKDRSSPHWYRNSYKPTNHATPHESQMLQGLVYTPLMENVLVCWVLSYT